MRKISSILTLILVVCLTVGGASAAWIYATKNPEAVDQLLNIGANFTYTVTYMNEGEVLYTTEPIAYGVVKDLADDHNKANIKLQEQITRILDETDQSKYKVDYTKVTFSNVWINAGSTVITKTPENNIENITLYPSFDNLYTASFVNQQGSVLDWFTYSTYTTAEQEAKATAEANALAKVEAAIPEGSNLVFDYWEVRVTKNGTTTKHKLDNYSFGDKVDVTIYPYYRYTGAALNPVDTDNDGDIDYYEVTGYTDGKGSELVEIPDAINGSPVTTINADAFSSYANLQAVKIPASVTTISSGAFAEYEGIFRKRQTVTLYYEGTQEQWAKLMALQYDGNSTNNPFASDWDDAMGEGSRVFFLDTSDNVINDANTGYWELANTGSSWNPNFVWQYHAHAYPYNSSQHSCSNEHNQNDTNYTDKTKRSDYEYWE